MSAFLDIYNAWDETKYKAMLTAGRPDVPAAEKAELAGRSFDGAYSFAKSCEIVLSDNLPFAYESIAYLVDETTSAKR